MKKYLIWAGLALLGWMVISSPMSKEEARHSPVARRRRGVIALIVAGACVWFAYWALSSHCGGGC